MIDDTARMWLVWVTGPHMRWQIESRHEKLVHARAHAKELAKDMHYDGIKIVAYTPNSWLTIKRRRDPPLRVVR